MPSASPIPSLASSQPRFIALSCLVALAGLLPLPAAAKLEHLTLDPVHTRVAFQVSHAGFSRPIGTFSGVRGSLDFDQDDWSQSRLDVTIPVRSLNLGDEDWQRKILDRTFFDAEKFPDARFVSTAITAIDASHAQVVGDLTLHGVTQPVQLQVTLNQFKRHPLTFKKTAGFSASGTLSRKAFGIDAWKTVVGDEVGLIIEAEATRDAEDADPK